MLRMYLFSLSCSPSSEYYVLLMSLSPKSIALIMGKTRMNLVMNEISVHYLPSSEMLKLPTLLMSTFSCS